MYKYIVVVLLTIVSFPMLGLSSLAQGLTRETQSLSPIFQPEEACSDQCSDRGSGRRDQYKDASYEAKERGSGRLEPDPKESK